VGCCILSLRGATQLRRGNLVCGRQSHRFVILRRPQADVRISFPPFHSERSEESVREDFLHCVILNGTQRSEESGWGRLFPLLSGRDSHGRAMPSLGVTGRGVALCHCEPSAARRGDLVCGRQSHRFVILRRPQADVRISFSPCHSERSEESVRDYFHCLVFPNQILRFTQNDTLTSHFLHRFFAPLCPAQNDTL